MFGASQLHHPRLRGRVRPSDRAFGAQRQGHEGDGLQVRQAGHQGRGLHLTYRPFHVADLCQHVGVVQLFD